MSFGVRRAVRFLAWATIVVVSFCVITFDIPLLTGQMMIDARDPNRPGHLIDVFPTPLGLGLEALLLVAGVVVLLRTRD